MKPKLIAKIETLLGSRPLHAAPLRAQDPFGGLMAYKEGMFKYQMEGEALIGLNLSGAGLSDEQWQGILALPGLEAGGIRALNLSDNQLSRFELPPGMRALERLDLSGNRLASFTLPAGFSRLHDLILEDNPLSGPPPEILKQGRQATLRYLQELAAQGERQVYEVKILIVGEGHTGKTTLWNTLQNPNHPVPDETQASTVGIGIKEGWVFDHPDHPGTPSDAERQLRGLLPGGGRPAPDLHRPATAAQIPAGLFLAAGGRLAALHLPVPLPAQRHRRPPDRAPARVPGKSGRPQSYLGKLQHLSPLKRGNSLLPWDDSRLFPGEEWDEKIRRELAGADIILLLLSSAALASDYFWNTEMEMALERHRRGEARVIPVIIRPCDWRETPLKKLAALPPNGQPVSTWPGDQDEAWMQVVAGIKKALL